MLGFDFSDYGQVFAFVVWIIGIVGVFTILWPKRKRKAAIQIKKSVGTPEGVVFQRPTLADLGGMQLALVKHSADDLDVVNAARVSFAEHVDEVSDRDKGLIGFLLRNHHGTPFEHPTFTFRVKAPIAVFREWHRHRVGHSYNEISGRYVKLKREFAYPTPRLQRGKPGAYNYAIDRRWRTKLIKPALWCAYNVNYAFYSLLVKLGVAKEAARFCLPVSTMSEMYWTCNARSLMHFLGLRNAESAMREIRLLAQCAEFEFAQVMPITATKFVENGRVAP